VERARHAAARVGLGRHGPAATARARTSSILGPRGVSVACSSHAALDGAITPHAPPRPHVGWGYELQPTMHPEVSMVPWMFP
jgi:hypothetical protein